MYPVIASLCHQSQTERNYRISIWLQVLKLVVICLVATQTLAAEDHTSHSSVQTPSPVRRPNEHLEPPPPPSSRAATPTTQRRASTRLSSIRISGPHRPPVLPGNVRHGFPPPTGNGPQIHAKSNRTISANLASVRHGKPSGNIPPLSSADRHRLGSSGKGEFSTSTAERNSRWFFSSDDSEVREERKTGVIEVLRPPPPPSSSLSFPPNYNLVQSAVGLTASGTHHQPSVLQYGAPPHHKSKTRECNPCNKVPWIPMIRTHGDVQLEGLSHAVNGHAPVSNTYLPPAPISSQYDSPSIGSLPLQSHDTGYGAPLPAPHLPGDQYGPPPPSGSTVDQYAGLPLSSVHPAAEYGPPPPLSQHIHTEHKPPPIQASQHPGNEYGPPQKPEGEYGPPPPPSQDIHLEYKPPPLPASLYQGNNFGQVPPPNLKETGYLPPPLPEPPRTEYVPPPRPPQSGYNPLPPPPDQYGPPQQDTIKEPTSPHLAPSYLPAPPLYEPEPFNGGPQSAVSQYPLGINNGINNGQIYNQNSGNSYGENGSGGGSGHSEIDVVQSVSLIDSHPVESQHPVTSGLHDAGYTGVSSIHLVPFVSTTPKTNTGEWHKEEAARLPNNQFHLPSEENYQQQGHNYHLNNASSKNLTNEASGLEVIPSVQVADYLSSVEYPLQIVQSPYIDVTENPDHRVKQINEQQTYDIHPPAHPSSYGGDEVIIGKTNLAASNLNKSNSYSYNSVGFNTQNNVSDIQDQKQQQSAIHETSSGEHFNEGPVSLNKSPTSGVVNSFVDNTYLATDNQIKHITEDVNILRGHGENQAPFLTKENGSVFDIQPSIQTSAEGNSLIHQINNAFQSHTDSTTVSPLQNTYKQLQNSDYILFQNFPQPPLSYLPADVLKQQLPPPTKLHSTLQKNPYLPPFPSQSQTFTQSTSPLPTRPFEHALKLEAPALFLNPPPKGNGQYSTVTSSPLHGYSFWTAEPRPPSSSLSPLNNGNLWESEETKTPLKMSQENIIAAFAEAAGLLPPPPSLSETSNQSNKKTKQIQIIVPYTSSKDLMHFKIQDTNKSIFDTTGWLPITSNEDIKKQQGRKAPPLNLNCSDDEESWRHECKISSSLSEQEQNDYHQHQESRTVTATAPPVQGVKEVTKAYPQKSYSEIQHIFATNIRDLLRGEEDAKRVPDSITLQRLQKNIDEWTALEYSKRKDAATFNKTRNTDGGKKSTAAPMASGTQLQHLLVPSKKIPDEYLTTTPTLFDDVTSTDNSIATAIPSFKSSRSTTTTTSTTTSSTTAIPESTISTTTLHSSFNNYGFSGSYQRTVSFGNNKNSESHSKENINQDVPLNHQRKGENQKWKNIASNYIIPEVVSATTKKTTILTTAPPITTSPSNEQVVTDIYANTGHTTWDQIPISISPITNEKVYVVTPMANWTPDFTTPTPYLTSPYSTNTHSTSINDVFPFRNGPPSVQKLLASVPLSFKSPRFIVRPTPGATVQRLYTVTSVDDDDDDESWNNLKTTTVEPAKLNELDGNTGKLSNKLGPDRVKMECANMLLVQCKTRASTVDFVY